MLYKYLYIYILYTHIVNGLLGSVGLFYLPGGRIQPSEKKGIIPLSK